MLDIYHQYMQENKGLIGRWAILHKKNKDFYQLAVERVCEEIPDVRAYVSAGGNIAHTPLILFPEEFEQLLEAGGFFEQG